MKKSVVVLLVILGLAAGHGFSNAGTCENPDVIVWTFQTGKCIYSNPVIHENVLYIGSFDSVFYAVDPRTGQEIWHYRTDHPVHSDAAIFNGGLCFESGNQLYFLDFQGTLIRKVPLCTETYTEQIDSWDFPHSSPVVVDDMVYIGSEKGWIYGIDSQTGDVRFQVQTPNQGTIRIPPLVEGDRLFTGDWDGVARAYDLTTSEMIWEYDTRKDVHFAWTNAIQTRMVLHNNALHFAGRSCNAYALNADTGAKIWNFDQSSVWIVGGAVVADDLVYYGCSNQRVLYAQDAATGANRWGTGLDDRMWNSPLVDGPYLFFGSGSFYILDRFTGEVINKLVFDHEKVHTEPIHIWYWDADYWGDAYALANFHSSAVAFEGKIIVGCDDGKIYAFDREGLINMPKSNTFIKGQPIDLGDVSKNSTPSVSVTVYNTGTKTDTVLVSLSGGTKLKQSLSIDTEKMTIPANDSVTVTVTIDPENLKINDYIFRVVFDSQQNIANNRMMQEVNFNLVEGTRVDEQAFLPGSFALNPNRPNPFNPSTKIGFDLPEDADIRIFVTDIRGRQIGTLVQGRLNAGRHDVVFDAHELNSGVYLCVMDAGPYKGVQKMIVLK
ncbi:PQQ-binding-like beta-propeller repeat protein [bacterium]|nr:PQQ-binding-like beta-propeller repeat protein [bacterium]